MSGAGVRTGMANPLHWVATDPDVLWSPGNVSEAIPGVSTALNWSFVDDAVELAARQAFAAMGVLRPDEVRLNDRAEDRFMVAFYGRTVANIEAMRGIGDRTPGTSANAVEAQLFGVVRPDAVNHPTLSRLPTIALRMPRTATRLRRDSLALRAEIVEWWRGAVLAPPTSLPDATALLADARRRYTRAFSLGVLSSMLAQAVYDQVVLLVRNADRHGLQHRLVTGYAGMLETGLVTDLWDLAHDRLDRTTFLLRHGFHGPDEGQLASRVWREDPGPLDALVRRYAGLGPDAHPALAERRQVEVRETAEAELLAALGRMRAPGARLVLRIARTLIPLREIGKANYTQCLDGARLAARAIGRELAAAGRLDDAEDVFGLTYDELTAPRLPDDLRTLAAERAAIRADYLTTDLPDKFTGPPPRIPLAPADDAIGDTPAADAPVDKPITGEGVGGGVDTGRARVVVDPATDDLEPGEILVCRSTDPGWTSLFHLAAGVAVDLGGTMSHAAIVARELGIPCLTCTGDGTRRVRTGDLVRLDGDAGILQVLERDPGRGTG
ncbi:PEP-utilizing enzyme [Sporichthya polymorpha]|uniref:PEP-utilizing enzyme n=1 Tax=Sporichthya polymorpha TaxID=35751 RepID=UPI0003A103B5|nr:PEP-utilizing enzyme [Sporichthya polymorpha]